METAENEGESYPDDIESTTQIRRGYIICILRRCIAGGPPILHLGPRLSRYFNTNRVAADVP